MNTQTLVLFLACLLLSGFNFILNAHITQGDWLKKITILWGLVGLFGATTLLVTWFILLIKGLL